MTDDDSNERDDMTKTNWESDDAYRARLIAERARRGMPHQPRAVKSLRGSTGFDLDLWGRDLNTPRLGVSADYAAAVLAWKPSADVRPQPAPAAAASIAATLKLLANEDRLRCVEFAGKPTFALQDNEVEA